MTALVLAALIAAQVPGQTIRAKDGDVILVENDDKVKVVRRRHANVRIIHNAEQRWVLILADWLGGASGGDGRVDWSFDFREVTGEWPLGARWEGEAFVDQYDLAPEGPNRGMGITTSGGLAQLLSSSPAGRGLTADRTFADPSAVAVLMFRGSGGASTNEPFDIAELGALTRFRQGAAGTSPGGLQSGVSLRVTGLPTGDYPAPTQPVRVGGNLSQPQKIKHADPVMPEAARQAGARGTVVLDIVIGADGTVQPGRILRSISLLDAAAIAAVKQWVYEPTLLNGAPVAVIMTVTVEFR